MKEIERIRTGEELRAWVMAHGNVAQPRFAIMLTGQDGAEAEVDLLALITFLPPLS